MSNGPTPQDIEDFGPELVGFAQRAAAPVVDQRVGQLEQQIAQLQADAVRQRVITALDANSELAGRWRKLNEDPAFLTWLNQTDQLAGVPRLQLMRQAFDFGDAARTAKFFMAFLAQQIPERQRTNVRLPLEEQSKATIRSRDLAPRRLWKRAEIEKFYRDVAAGRYVDHEAERLRIEQEIVAAARERRIADPPLQLKDGK